MTVKFTMFFQQATNVSNPTRQPRRLGGWSESWYFNGTVQQAIDRAFNGGGVFGTPGLCPTRAGLLPLGASIVGQRVQVVTPVGPSQSLSRIFAPATMDEEDNPQQALLCRVPGAGVANIRKTILRGIPDTQIFEGEFNSTLIFFGLLNTFFLELAAWQFRGRDLSRPQIAIININAAGVVQTETPHGLAVGQIVRILRTRTSAGNLIGFRGQVAAIGPGNNTFTLYNWPGQVTTGGSVRVDQFVYLNVQADQITVGRLITRRVGRPFAQYRGRRSKKHT